MVRPPEPIAMPLVFIKKKKLMFLNVKKNLNCCVSIQFTTRIFIKKNK